MPDKAVNVLLFLAQGFEDLEAITILNVFGWTQYREHIPNASITKTGFHEVVKSRFGLEIRSDIVFLVLFLALGCAPKKMAQPPPQSHFFPFTEVIGDYHLRLIVDHADGGMALVFEDYAERPLKPVDCDNIEGRVTFSDGSVEEVVFRTHTSPGEKFRRRYYSRKYSLLNQCGIFTVRREWIKTTSKFTLEVTVVLRGERYQRTFEYEAPGGGVPYHGR